MAGLLFVFDLSDVTHTVAAFDFDGTLTTRDCVVPFLRRVVGSRRLVAGLAALPHRTVPAAVRRDRDDLKAIAAEVVFRGRSVDEIRELGELHAHHVLSRWMRTDTVERLGEYRSAGVPVVIVSASFDVYLDPIGKLLGVDAVLATRLEAADGHFTGRLNGPNCRGDEKVRRLDAWCGERGVRRDELLVHAYGDSPGDHALLRTARHAWWAGNGDLSTWSGT